jgi:hypothetical protein
MKSKASESSVRGKGVLLRAQGDIDELEEDKWADRE